MGELEKTVGYTFQDPKLLELALTHSSYAHEHYAGKRHDNERLEFLGDAVLELVSSDYLFHNYNEYPEGELTKLRASIVCEQSLAMCAEAISLGKYLRLGNGEDSTGGRLRASITSDAMEALIGAIYLDGGFANAKEFITRFVLNDLENKKLFSQMVIKPPRKSGWLERRSSRCKEREPLSGVVHSRGQSAKARGWQASHPKES
jgi:ribonuclease-3